jgi:glycosyltransferase involved in cell wall biosynthesis
MKVLVFNHAFFHISETFIYKQVTGMPADIQIELLGFDIVNEDVFPLHNKKHKIKRSTNKIDKAIKSIIRRIFNHKYNFSAFTYFKVKKLLKRSRFDLVHAHFGFNALMIYPLLKLLKIPLVVTFHGLDASPQFLNKKKYKSRLKKMLEYASAIIIVSPHMTDTLHLERLQEKTHLIPCGVDAFEFDKPDKSGHTGSINILHSGRLVSKKGVPDLISVFSQLSHKYPDIRLGIIGEGSELSLCKKIAADARPGSIQFYGKKTHDEVRRIMSDTDIFVLNSRLGNNGDMEGLPVSLLEAMSMKLAVVSTRHAGIPQAITNEADGLLVDEKDNSALLQAIEKLIVNAGLRKQLGEAARVTILNRFTSEETNRKISGVYRSMEKV